jgi:hypothetical protein
MEGNAEIKIMKETDNNRDYSYNGWISLLNGMNL